jgi:electron transfer flavoprotein alpha subunit
MSTLVLVEVEEGRAALVSRETLTFARELGGDVHALVLAGADVPDAVVADCGEQGAGSVLTVPDAPSSYAAAAWATILQAALQETGASHLLAAGTPRGNELLAHIAARRRVPMGANVVSVSSVEPLRVVRQVVGGAALEDMALDADLHVLTVAGHAVEPVPAESAGAATVSPLAVSVPESDLRARLVRVEGHDSGDTSGLTSAKVVVGAGRGAGGPDGFDGVIALADRLGGALGVSRVVTSLGWRPHHEQVGQTGSRISPDVYIPCGISGAIQHWAGCASSRTIIAINTDPDAPMVTKATYAVIGDMHEVVPAIVDALG